MRVNADEICLGDTIRWGDETYTVEHVRSDGSLRHIQTAEGLALVFHALEQVEVSGPRAGRTAA